VKLTLTNIGILLGAVAVAYAINKVVKTKTALESISNVQYSPSWDDNITGNKAESVAGTWV